VKSDVYSSGNIQMTGKTESPGISQGSKERAKDRRDTGDH
jgi:hypothetical protein